MRALLFLLASVALATGCNKADPKPDGNAKVEPQPAPKVTPKPKVQPKVPNPIGELPKVDPKTPAVADPGYAALLAELEKYGGYDEDGLLNKFPHFRQLFALQGKVRARPAGAPNDINFAEDEPSDADLKALRPFFAKCQTPLALEFTGKRVTLAGLEHLRGIPCVRKLSLSGKLSTDAALKAVAGFTDLQALDVLNANAVTDAGVAHLVALKNLRQLRVVSATVTDAALDSLVPLAQLEELFVGVSDQITEARSQKLAKFPNLRKVTLYGDGATDAALAALKSLTELRELEVFSRALTTKGLSGLAAFPKLEVLVCFTTEFDDAAVAALAGAKNLRALEIRCSQLTKTGGEVIGKLSGLKRLVLINPNGRCLAGLNGLTQLEVLKVEFPLRGSISDDDLKALPALPALGELDLKGSKNVSDESVPALKRLKALQKLNAQGTGISDKGADELLAALPGVELTDAFGAKRAAAKAEPQPTPKSGEPAKGPADFKLTADELVARAKANEAQLVGKVIEVSGEVEGFDRSTRDGRQVLLKTAPLPNSPKDFPFSIPVMCAVVDPEPWATVLPGQRVKITGTFEMALLSANLKACRITDAGEPVELKQTPKEIQKEAEADRDAAKAKYKDKWLRATGEVTDKRSEFGSAVIVLSVGGTTVECTANVMFAGAFKKGEKVTVAGKVFAAEANVVKLVSVYPVTKK